MSALMICLTACAITVIGGPWWRRIGHLATALPAWQCGAAVMTSILVCAAISAFGGHWVASHAAGPGLQLLLALALASGAIPLLWPQAAPRPAGLSRTRLPWVILTLTTVQIGDSAQFILFAVAAWSGHPWLAGIGGVAGLAAAGAAAAYAERTAAVERIVKRARLGFGGILLIASAVVALVATGRL